MKYNTKTERTSSYDNTLNIVDTNGAFKQIKLSPARILNRNSPQINGLVSIHHTILVTYYFIDYLLLFRYNDDKALIYLQIIEYDRR